ncbi:hypothetical protein MCERE19_03826 [Spirosomataceae bacterium]|jgi:hypothetical protein
MQKDPKFYLDWIPTDSAQKPEPDRNMLIIWKAKDGLGSFPALGNYDADDDEYYHERTGEALLPQPDYWAYVHVPEDCEEAETPSK